MLQCVSTRGSARRLATEHIATAIPLEDEQRRGRAEKEATHFFRMIQPMPCSTCPRFPSVSQFLPLRCEAASKATCSDQPLQLIHLDPDQLINSIIPVRHRVTISSPHLCGTRVSTGGLTDPHASRQLLPNSIALPVTHKKSNPPSLCIRPTGILIISSSVRVP